VEFEDVYQTTLQSEAYAFNLKRDVIRVSGPDAESFLQGQMSQDIVQMNPGDSAWSFLLNPNGKISSWFRISQISDSHFLLDVDEDFGEETVKRLFRFKLRVQCDIELEQWNWVAIRGSGAAKYQSLPNVDLIAASSDWPLVEGVDLIGASIYAPEELTVQITQEFELLRILNGVPRMGKEMDAETIPAETGLVERSVSFTKGCYTGQELVARIDSRGNKVPKHLRILFSEYEITQGDSITISGENIGYVTSSCTTLSGAVGLAYISRKFKAPIEATVGGLPVKVELLP
jgi:folate-binding protein YgfZ